MIRKQRGLSLIGVLIVGAILAFLFFIGMRTVPVVTEYLAVKRSISAIVADVRPDTSPSEVRSEFGKRASVEYIESVKPQDLVVIRHSGGYEVSVEYSKKVPIAGNVSLLLEFNIQESSVGRP